MNLPESGTTRTLCARQNTIDSLGAYFGSPVFIRIIKEDLQLELWVQQGGKWRVLKSYPIAGMSGTLGPKVAEGDRQAPEGFYSVTPQALNPRSKYHLSFNIGYPNAYDRAQGRTGSYIMVHGGVTSSGCFAMTDAGIEEIYTLVHEAFLAGQESIPVQIYPFRMVPERMMAEQKSPHYAFWSMLQHGWLHTEQHREPAPALYIC
ncbi:MAG: murein L,D-transpeptidase [Akkermansia sp.]|nr:murein L,D-transpeptidase [Akkermansia sp.]